MKRVENVDKIIDVILSHTENTEECHLKAVKLIEIGKQLYEMDECPRAFADILANAIVNAGHCSYREELYEPVRRLIRASVFMGFEDLMRDMEV